MRPEKKQLVDDIRALLEPAGGIFLISYKGLTVKAFNDLRGSLDAVGASCHVIPNRLFLRAAADAGMDRLAGADLASDTAMVTCESELVPVARALRDFSKGHAPVALKMAVVDGQVVGPEDALRIAELPSKAVLQAQLLGVLNAPAGQLVGVLNAKVASVVYLLSAYLKEKEQAA